MLLVNHGKRCPRCAKNGKPRKASDGDCPLFGTKTVNKILKEELDTSTDVPNIKQDPDAAPGSANKKQKSDDQSDEESETSLTEDIKVEVKKEANASPMPVKPDPDIKDEPGA